MKLDFDLTAEEFTLTRKILADVLTPKTRVWVFGSRAKNQARFNSDLDLALESATPLPVLDIHRLKEAFNDAPLPYRVDVLDIHTVPASFQAIIRQQAKAFPMEAKTPKLRFAEFSAEWTEKHLGELVKPNPSNVCLPPNFFYIDLESVSQGQFSQTQSISRDNAPSRAQRLLEPKDILFQLVRPYQKNNLFFNKKGNYVASTGYAQLKAYESPSFLYFAIHDDRFVNRVLERCTGTNYPAINSKSLLEIKIRLPHLDEQRKIAAFLTAADDKIAALKRKKTLLENHKKGMMQQIFSQKIRFKDDAGNDFPDWKEKRLGELGEFHGGGTPQTSMFENWNGEIQWFTPTEIKQKYLFSSKRTITETGFKNSSAKILPIGSLLLSTRASVGDVSIAQVECTTNQGFQSLAVNVNNSNEFLYYWILAHQKIMLRLASGSTFLEISKSDISNLSILVPHLEEQRKIADFLSALDKKIQIVHTELTQAQTFKKGLLQQMFV